MIHGVLNVYKEKGFTSHDVVAKLRGITGQKKIGHTGTLDPDAVGVLPVCLGKATKLCGMLTDEDKTYEAVLLLGCDTDTQDVGGQILREADTSGLDERTVELAIKGFVGEYAQIPPMYSALKVHGKKLYELAREGKEIDREARMVTIYQIHILDMQIPRVRMEVTCSRGTYIRTLCHDIGESLGCYGCMEELIRTRAGRFCMNDSLTLEEIQKLQQNDELNGRIVPIDAMFEQYRGFVVKDAWDTLAKNGNPLPAESTEPLNCETDGYKNREYVRLYDKNGCFIALYAWNPEKKEYRAVKMFYTKETDHVR